jgi:tryptophanyl-tRNA synthetase
LELAKDLTERYNKLFKDDIAIPGKLYFNENKYTYNRVMSLQDVTKKMSKSDKQKKACINLIDDPEMIRLKI